MLYPEAEQFEGLPDVQHCLCVLKAGDQRNESAPFSITSVIRAIKILINLSKMKMQIFNRAAGVTLNLCLSAV